MSNQRLLCLQPSISALPLSYKHFTLSTSPEQYASLSLASATILHLSLPLEICANWDLSPSFRRLSPASPLQIFKSIVRGCSLYDEFWLRHCTQNDHHNFTTTYENLFRIALLVRGFHGWHIYNRKSRSFFSSTGTGFSTSLFAL